MGETDKVTKKDGLFTIIAKRVDDKAGVIFVIGVINVIAMLTIKDPAIIDKIITASISSLGALAVGYKMGKRDGENEN